jgi:5-methylcytosine-specific restriction endonuclease McrA
MREVLGSNLTGLKQKSCGCLSREMAAKRVEDSRTSDEHKRELDRARKRRYNASDKGRAAQQRYFDKNKEAAYARASKWSKDNPESGRASVRNRRAKIKSSDGQHTAADIERIGSEQGWKCAFCFKDISGGYHVDHVVPISKGGSNSEWNLHLTCQTCNLKKAAKSMKVFLKQSKPWLFNVALAGEAAARDRQGGQ